jgi:hypothetical protein
MRTRPTTGSAISVEAASMLCTVALVTSNPPLLTHAFYLALRGPEDVKKIVEPFAQAFGFDIQSPELQTPVTKEEVKAFLAPVLASAATLASLGHMFDEYLWDLTPDGVAYLFYSGIRFFKFGNRTPNHSERREIWRRTWTLIKASHIGRKHWADLETKGGNALKDWQMGVQESARKKYKTFLRQKKKVDASSASALETLMSMFN